MSRIRVQNYLGKDETFEFDTKTTSTYVVDTHPMDTLFDHEFLMEKIKVMQDEINFLRDKLVTANVRNKT
jgi:hypothetical protein